MHTPLAFLKFKRCHDSVFINRGFEFTTHGLNLSQLFILYIICVISIVQFAVATYYYIHCTNMFHHRVLCFLFLYRHVILQWQFG